MKTDLSAHRNLYNGDCTFLFGKGYLLDEGRYSAAVLHNFVDTLADSGVDTLLMNTCAQIPWYPSKVVRSVLDGYTRGDREFFRGHYPPANDTDLPSEKLEAILDAQVIFVNRYLDLAEDGVDWVEEIAKACRRTGISPWVSVRMNDMHGANSWENSYMNADLQKDPRYWLSGREINPKDGVNYMLRSMCFEHREVRDYMFAIIREMVEDYDYEGLELDWLRCPFCCEPPASQEKVDMMTAWFAEIRALTRRQAERIGKPYPLGMRIPARLDQLRQVGIDVRALAREGVLDFVSPSNFWQTSWDIPLDRMRCELGPDVTLYGVVEAAPNWLDAWEPKTSARGYRLLASSGHLLRGNAAGKLALGVDGIEQFNFFCADEVDIHPSAAKRQAQYAELRGLEDLEGLRGKTKQYTLSSRLGYFMFPLFEHAEQIPVTIEPDWKQAFRLPMCAEPEGCGLEFLVQVVVEKKDAMPNLGVSFNGGWPTFDARPTDELLFPTGVYTHHVPEHTAFNFAFDPSLIRDGWNEILVFNASHEKQTPQQRLDNSVRVVSLEAALK